MTKTSLLVCLAFLTTLLASQEVYTTYFGQRTAPVIPRVPRTYHVDLDASYEDQWSTIIADFKPQVLKAADSLLKITGGLDPELASLINYTSVEQYDKEFAQEMQVISSLLGLPFNEVVFLNFIYEGLSCTSIVIQDDKGNIYHGRNLDFDDAPEITEILYHGKYFRNGQLVYEAVSAAGYIGVSAAMRPNAYSFSINAYLNNEREIPTLWDHITARAYDIVQGMKGKTSPPILAKRAIETVETYDEFVAYLNSTEPMSDVFYIIGGTEPGQGAVIGRLRESVENFTTLDANAGDWYLVQTNYVQNAPDPAFDNRATAARNWLNSIGQANITKELLANEILSVYPVFDNETIHTTIMEPKTGYFNVTLWGW